MEYSLPPVVGPEPSFTPEAPEKKKSRWSVFEMFRKKDEEAEEPVDLKAEAKTAERSDARSEQEPAKRRRFGEAIIRLLRGESEKPEPKVAEAREPKHRAATEQAGTAKPEAEPSREPQTIVERAQEMGRSVMRLIGQVKSEVAAADQREPAEAPTDTQPLDEADARIRVAMRELVAPLEAYAAEHGIPDQPFSPDDEQSSPEQTAQPEALATPAETGGGDRTFVIPEQPRRTNMFEAAAAAAAAAAERVVSRVERAKDQSRTRLGLFAVGAATVGVLVYNWRRNQALKKEQRAFKKERVRFEKEVKQQQQADRQRLEHLEQTPVAGMSRAERQEHVYEVSRYATHQAEVIHQVAKKQGERQAVAPVTSVERLRPAAMPVVEAPRQREPIPASTMPEVVTQARTFTEAPRRVFTGSEVRPEEKSRRPLVERALEALRPRQSSFAPESTATAGGGGGLGGFASTIMSLTTGKAPAEPAATSAFSPQPAIQRKRTGQEWLLGVSLAIGVAGVVLLLVNFL